MAVGDLCSIRVHTDTYAQRNEIAWGFISTTGVANWRKILADGFATLFVPVYVAGQVDITAVREVRGVDVVPGTGADVLGTLPLDSSGHLSLTPMPPQVAAKLTWRTATPGRSGRGCSFIPGMPNNRVQLQSQVWNSTGQAYLQSLVTTLLTAYGPTGTSTFARLCIISRRHDLADRPVPIGIPVTGGDYLPEVRSQRRRQEL